MFPAQPVPIMTTGPNFTGTPMGMEYMPQNLINSPQNFVFFMDPFTELSQCSGAIIRQQVEYLEAITGCETQNRYHVFLLTPMGLKYAFKCNERSDSCSRCCCPASNRPLELIIRHIISSEQLNTDLAKIFIHVNKPCVCGCCCFCRPHMDVRLADNNALIGKVREPCTCCDLDTEIYDSAGNYKYLITGDCCQAGLCCCQKLSSVKFNILQNNSYVGSMRKLSARNFGEFFTKADSYQIDFLAKATPEEKMLLIIAGLMIDYQNFEDDSNDNVPTNPYYY
jgi:hypothetical protein